MFYFVYIIQLLYIIPEKKKCTWIYLRSFGILAQARSGAYIII